MNPNQYEPNKPFTPNPETKYRQALERIRDYPLKLNYVSPAVEMSQIARQALEEEPEQEPVEAIITAFIICPKCQQTFHLPSYSGPCWPLPQMRHQA